jgi:hypothetical protein
MSTQEQNTLSSKPPSKNPDKALNVGRDIKLSIQLPGVTLSRHPSGVTSFRNQLRSSDNEDMIHVELAVKE